MNFADLRVVKPSKLMQKASSTWSTWDISSPSSSRLTVPNIDGNKSRFFLQATGTSAEYLMVLELDGQARLLANTVSRKRYVGFGEEEHRRAQVVEVFSHVADTIGAHCTILMGPAACLNLCLKIDENAWVHIGGGTSSDLFHHLVARHSLFVLNLQRTVYLWS